MEISIDEFDRKILTILQGDAARPVRRHCQAGGGCRRRHAGDGFRLLEEAGVIRGRVALLDRGKLNVGVTVFVAVRTNQHNQDWLERFRARGRQHSRGRRVLPHGGDIDYLLRVVVPDIAAYDGVYKRLIQKIDLTDVSSTFAMEELKYTTAVPLTYAARSSAG
jgi:Lrp/AsnC family transcriptional regulator